MEESDQVTVTIPHSDPPQVDVVKLVELLLISKPPATEVSLASCYNSVSTFIISVMRRDHLLLYSPKNVDILLYCTWCVPMYCMYTIVYLHVRMYTYLCICMLFSWSPCGWEGRGHTKQRLKVKPY